MWKVFFLAQSEHQKSSDIEYYLGKLNALRMLDAGTQDCADINSTELPLSSKVDISFKKGVSQAIKSNYFFKHS